LARRDPVRGAARMLHSGSPCPVVQSPGTTVLRLSVAVLPERR
jgi:hypothetical protein